MATARPAHFVGAWADDLMILDCTTFANPAALRNPRLFSLARRFRQASVTGIGDLSKIRPWGGVMPPGGKSGFSFTIPRTSGGWVDLTIDEFTGGPDQLANFVVEIWYSDADGDQINWAEVLVSKFPSSNSLARPPNQLLRGIGIGRAGRGALCESQSTLVPGQPHRRV